MAVVEEDGKELALCRDGTESEIVPLVRLTMVREGQRLYKKRKFFASSKDAYNFFTPLLKNADREEFWTAALDARNRPIAVNRTSVGSLSQSLIHPREVFKFAFLANAAGIILCHNHPSGNPAPSPEDHEVTRRLSACSEIFALPLTDHIILGHGDYYSYSDQGRLRGFKNALEISTPPGGRNGR